MKGAAYIRVSTDEQLEFSPDSQLKKIQEFAAGQGISILEDHIYREDGISGREAARRPAFQRMISAAKSNPRPFDVILVWKFSRFARSRSDSIFYKTLLRSKLGIDILSVSEPIGRDKTSKIYESIIEVMDEYYCDNLSEEVRRGMEERFSRGRIIAPPPFGYQVLRGAYVPEPETANIVRHIFQLYAEGVPLRAIAAGLNAEGVCTRHGRPFEVRTIRYILTNPAYLGFLRKRDADGAYQTVSGEHPPLVDQELFDACAKRLAQKGENPLPYSRGQAVFPLSGLIRCSNCGSTLTMSSRAGRLQCCAYTKGKCTVSHSISVQKLEEAVYQQLGLDLAGVTVSIKNAPVPLQTASPVVIRRREEAKLSRIRQAYEAGVYSLDDLARAQQAFAQKLAALQQEIQEEEQVSFRVNMPLPLLLRRLRESGFTELINTILKSVLQEVIFYRPQTAIQIVYRSDLE